MPKTIGLFRDPWPPELANARSSRNPSQLFRYAVWYKANPRSEERMRELFHEYVPEGEFVAVDRDPAWLQKVAETDSIVLLYPDCTGLFQGRLEREVLRGKPVRASVRVLNGRSRLFLLTPAVRRSLRLRRFLERTMLLEMAANVVFLLVTPILLILDLARGRR